ncbi:hypothetical protein Dimus_034606, partial [Dionaea muscipula]
SFDSILRLLIVDSRLVRFVGGPHGSYAGPPGMGCDKIHIPRPNCIVDGLKITRSGQRRWVEDECWSASMVGEDATAMAISISGGRGWASA